MGFDHENGEGAASVPKSHHELDTEPQTAFIVSSFYHGNSLLLTSRGVFNRSKRSKKLVVRVYIVRHGETQENRDGIIQGQQDTPLNANGMEQARMVGEALKDAKIGVAFSSDLGRAVEVRGSNQTRDVNPFRPFVWEKEVDPPSVGLFYRFVAREAGATDTRSSSRRLKRYSTITQGSGCTDGLS